MVLVVQISVYNKSYECVDGIHAKEIVKNSYFECFPAILYVSFIRYLPVFEYSYIIRKLLMDQIPNTNTNSTIWTQRFKYRIIHLFIATLLCFN